MTMTHPGLTTETVTTIESEAFNKWRNAIVDTVDGVEITQHELSVCYRFNSLLGHVSEFHHTHPVMVENHNNMIKKGLVALVPECKDIWILTPFGRRVVHNNAKPNVSDLILELMAWSTKQLL